MQQQKFVQKNRQGLDEVRISDVKGIESPHFAPEIKGPECLQSILYAGDTLEENNPIVVPGFRWKDIRKKPMFKEASEDIQQLVSSHPFLYYEPVEFYRYTQPRNLVTYAFQGDRTKTKDFNNHLKNGNYDDAIEMLPEFFQPFIEAQMKSLLKKTEGASVPSRYENQSSGKIYEAWRDSRADEKFQPYFEEIVDDAAKSRNAAVIPPVPPVLKRSGTDVIHRTRGYNVFMKNLCESKSNSMSGTGVYPYLHFYVDKGIFSQRSDNDHRVRTAIKAMLENHDFAGLALTISNYEKIWSNNLEHDLERFITDVTNVAREEHVPVFLPRSGWYGAYLTDHGVQGFSSLMNGNATYNARGGGMDPTAKFGTTPIYGAAQDMNLDELETYLSNHGGSVPDHPDLPNTPPTYNASASNPSGKFGSAKHFRVKFGKAHRFIHVQEAREFRDGLKRGNPNPAQRYLERADHDYLS